MAAAERRSQRALDLCNPFPPILTMAAHRQRRFRESESLYEVLGGLCRDDLHVGELQETSGKLVGLRSWSMSPRLNLRAASETPARLVFDDPTGGDDASAQPLPTFMQATLPESPRRTRGLRWPPDVSAWRLLLSTATPLACSMQLPVSSNLVRSGSSAHLRLLRLPRGLK